MADNNTNQTFDPKQPLTFELTDGNVVDLITWDYVEDRLDRELSPVITDLEGINSQLIRIENRIDEWLEEQSS